MFFLWYHRTGKKLSSDGGWASAFNAENWEEVNQINNEGVQEAKKSMERIMSDSYRRQLLWDREMVL